MTRLTVDPAQVRAASALAARTAQDVAGVAAALGAVPVPDTGRADTGELVLRLLQQAGTGARTMAACVQGDGELLRAIAEAYDAAEHAAGGGPCG